MPAVRYWGLTLDEPTRTYNAWCGLCRTSKDDVAMVGRNFASDVAAGAFLREHRRTYDRYRKEVVLNAVTLD